MDDRVRVFLLIEEIMNARVLIRNAVQVITNKDKKL